MLSEAGRFDDAVDVRRRILAEEPEDPGHRNDLAWDLALAGRELDRALELARQAAEAMGDEPNVLDTLATVHWLRGEPGPALAVADRALTLEPGPVRQHLVLVRAAALAALGREDEAREALGILIREEAELAPPWRSRARALAHRLGVADGLLPAAWSADPEALPAVSRAEPREAGDPASANVP
jgi:Flp pilus assembly protein TadD